MGTVNTNSVFLFSLSAVRFGRIPKREKQRLLDEMQSYMNSLNEAASMEMEVSSSPDAPSSPQNQATDGAGSTSQSYHSNLINSDEKPLKMAAGNSNFAFQSSLVQEAAPPHTASEVQDTIQGDLKSGYHVTSSCTSAPTNNENSTNANVSKYHISNQNQCPVSGSHVSQSYAANHNSFLMDDSQNQNSCPWKLHGGAKVLVSLLFSSNMRIICQVAVNEKTLMTSSVCDRRVHSIHVPWLHPVNPARKCGSLSHSASPQL